MPKEEKEVEYRIIDDNSCINPTVNYNSALLDEISSGVTRITDVSDEEYLELRKYYASLEYNNNNRCSKNEKLRCKNILFRLKAVRFEGIPTTRQLEEEYSKDPFSYAFVISNGIEITIESVNKTGSRIETLFELRDGSIIEDSDVRDIERLLELCHRIDNSCPGISITTSDVYSWNCILLKLIHHAFSNSKESGTRYDLRQTD